MSVGVRGSRIARRPSPFGVVAALWVRRYRSFPCSRLSCRLTIRSTRPSRCNREIPAPSHGALTQTLGVIKASWSMPVVVRSSPDFASSFHPSFCIWLACAFWLLARDRFLQLARTFARDVSQIYCLARGSRIARRPVIASRCCGVFCSALSFLPAVAQVVPPNYSFKATVMGRCDKPAPGAAP